MPSKDDDAVPDAALEFCLMKLGPDGLVRITRRPSGAGINGSWVVSANEAERLILAEWAEFHRSLLGFMRSWLAAVR
jgi:hypothetical protein